MSARGCSQQIIASAPELKNLVDFSRIVILEKGPIQCEKLHFNPQLRSYVEHIIRELCPARTCINQYFSCIPQTAESRGQNAPWFAKYSKLLNLCPV